MFQRALLRGTLLAWAEDVLRELDYTPARHHRLLIAELEKLSDGQFDRLMVLMPPGSAKSTYTYVNSDLWGAYVPTPTTSGNWYMWVEGTDGSAQSVYATPFVVQ